MALPELLQSLRTQAAERRAEELARAEAEAARILAESRASSERRRLEWVERTRRDEGEAARRALARAEKEAAESVLAARDRLLARVAHALKARASLPLRDPNYLRALPGEVRGALERLPAGPVVVRASPELLETVREAVGEVVSDALTGAATRGHDVVVEPADFGTGFVATAPEVGVEIDGTLGTRIAHAWPRLAVAILQEVPQ
jgi:vacuolar-type H+-ATPase subunit E/Vma4